MLVICCIVCRHCSCYWNSIFAGLGTETVAVHQPDGRYRLYGYKWFSSASDADMSLTLARITDADGRVAEV